MTGLIATYRLQFRNGMTFDKAVGIIPYLKRLGISHLYASPIFSAVTGSTHGYDVVDHNEIDPAIGGKEGFWRLHHALRQHGMGLVLDIVPNHMAASLENPWWRSVVEYGKASPFAGHFDIDWREKLTLPILGGIYREVLDSGELTIAADPKAGCLALAYFDNRLPLQPGTYRMIAERLEGDDAAALEDLADFAGRGESPAAFHDAVMAFLASQAALRFPAKLENLSLDTAFVHRLHEAQPWRLIFWKEARRHLNYRRFFEVTGLVGVRVEDEAVFEDVHRLVLSLVRTGLVDGLRIDHVDGLAFPGSYLSRLRREVGPDVPILVEKILAEGEELHGDWPIMGTTGYEFIPTAASLLVDPDGAAQLARAYDRFMGRTVQPEAELRSAKELILRRNFEGELGSLARQAQAIRRRAGNRSVPRTDLADAIAGIIIGFDVYRTYGETGELAPADQDVLTRATTSALASHSAEPELIRFVSALLEGKAADAGAARFRTRFQQLTGPVMAKAVEDTLFYRLNAFIANNEVGCSPGGVKGDVDRFHRWMGERLARPSGLLATATHDTKRGEDARARLYALAEQPSLWEEAVERWSMLNANLRRQIKGAAVPGPEVEWLLYQSLAGAWPPLLRPGDDEALHELASRFLPYVGKALREAKRRTDWLRIDQAYEKAVLGYARGLLDPANGTFLDDFAVTLYPFIEAGAVNSVSQVLAKLTAPGVPDFYQGSEGLDLSLVDPDNRRPVDFARLQNELNRGLDDGTLSDALLDGTFKQRMIARCLACRRQKGALFTRGSYVPLQLSGRSSTHFVAYLRELDASIVLVVLQRLPLRRRQAGGPCGATVELPRQYDGILFKGVLGGEPFAGREYLPVETVLAGLPVGMAIGTAGS